MSYQPIQSIAFAALPKVGEALADGIFRGIVTQPDGTHCAVVRLNIKSKNADWNQAMTLVAEDGAQLPNKAVAGLLTSNGDLEPGLYWMCDEYDASCAWLFFSYGYCLDDRKSARGGALAVRLIPLTA